MRDTEVYGRTPREPINKRTIEKNTSEGIALSCTVLEIGIIKIIGAAGKRVRAHKCPFMHTSDSSRFILV